MLTLRARSSTARRSLPGHHHTLSVSWLRKQFRAVAVQRGQVTGVWESPEPVEGTDRFAELLQKAIAATGYTGSTVSLVLVHQHLVHLLIEVPPVKRSMLDKVVNRQAQQQRLFPGQAIWSIAPAESPKKGPPQYLLNLFPQLLLEELLAGAQRAGCYLTAVVPAPAVLRDQLFELPIPESQVAMIVALTGENTTVLVGRSDGRVLLARVLSGNWEDSFPRLMVDLKRTLLFVNQHEGVNVDHLWLFGPGAEGQVARIQEQAGLPTQVSPTPWSEDYWALAALRLEPTQSQNLVPPELRLAPQRHIFAKVVGSITALAVLASAFFSWKLHGMYRDELQNVQHLEQEVARLQARHQELQRLEAEAAHRRGLVDLVSANRPDPVPLWLLGYLGEAVPPDLVVTNFQCAREGPYWHLRLSGLPQPRTGQSRDLLALERDRNLLSNRLADGPFRVRFTPPDTNAVAAAAASAAPTNAAPSGATTAPGSADLLAFLKRLRADTGTAPTNAPAAFALEGWMHP